MGLQVVSGAALQCSFGVAPGTLNVLPLGRTMGSGPPAANIMDNIPMGNIAPFGMCQSLANPTVASATSAAMGVLTPMPCIPVIPAPWAPGVPTAMVAGKPGLNDSCKLNCAWGGVIQVTYAGQTTVQI